MGRFNSGLGITVLGTAYFFICLVYFTDVFPLGHRLSFHLFKTFFFNSFTYTMGQLAILFSPASQSVWLFFLFGGEEGRGGKF